MIRKRFPSVVGRFGVPGGALACLALSLGACSSQTTPPVNVLLVVLDTTRADFVPFDGETTPTLERLARDGVVFTHATSTSAWTLPSHGSMFTGQYVSTHGAHHETQLLRDEAVTMAELLAPTHETAGFSENVHIGPRKGFAQGFDHFEETWRDAREGRSLPTIERATRWLRNRDVRVPFFVFVNLMDAHLPYRPPGDVAERFLPESATAAQIERLRGFGERQARSFMTGGLGLSVDDLVVLRALYRAEIAWADARLGRLLREVGPELDRTLVIVVGDHGENLGEHGLMEHQFCLYETLLRVPMLMRLPGRFDGGRTRDDPVQIVDLLPTVSELLGVPDEARPMMEGSSLTAEADRDRPLIAEYMRPLRQRALFEAADPEFDFDRFDRRLQSIRIGSWKLIRSDRGEIELYDLDRDPAEETDLAAEREDTALRLAARLDDWARGRTVEPGEEPKLDEEAIRELKALGYL